MAVATVDKPGLAPGTPTSFTPTGGGASDFFPNDGQTFCRITCGATPATSVTFNSIKPCDQGSDHNIAYTCVANETKTLGPFPKDRFNNASDQAEVIVAGTTGTLRLEFLSRT